VRLSQPITSPSLFGNKAGACPSEAILVELYLYRYQTSPEGNYSDKPTAYYTTDFITTVKRFTVEAAVNSNKERGEKTELIIRGHGIL
jgi:hypothetical protein